jgi:outer membrane protein insertion porin family
MRRTPRSSLLIAACAFALGIVVLVAPRLALAQFGAPPGPPQGMQGDPSQVQPTGSAGAGPRQSEDELPPRSAYEAPEVAPQTGECHGPRVVRVLFSGLQRVSSGDIRDSVHTREGDCYSREALSRDAHALWDLGFFNDVQVAADPTDEGGILVRFALSERPSIREVRIEGRDAVEEDKIREVIELREGSVLSESAVRRTAQRIRDLYAEKGYFLAEIRTEIRQHQGNENEADVIFHIRENAQVQVRSVSFVGNANIPADELRGVMATQAGGFFSFLTSTGTYREEAFRNDIDLLHAAYYDRGYLNVEIENPRVALSSDRRYLDITIFVREGARYRLGRVHVTEIDENDQPIEPLGGRRRVREMLHANPDDWFSRSVIGRDILALQTYYRDSGYATVEVTPDIQPHATDNVVDLGVRVRRGPLTHVRRIVIRGNQKTSDRVIRRELAIMEGDRYSETGYQDSRRRVMALGYFERVDLSTEPVPDHPDQIVINVEVVERPTGTFQVGAGFSSVESIIATAQIQQLNLFGRGQSLTLQAQISALRQIFALRFVEPYLFDSNWSGAIDLYNTLRVYTDFTRQSTGGSVSVGYPLIGTYDLRLALTYTGEAVSVVRRGSALLTPGQSPSMFGNVPLANLFRNGFSSAIGASLVVDTRDNRLFPTNGIYARLGVDIADDPFTGAYNISYIRWSGFFRFYYPLFLGIVFKGNLTGGFISSRDPRGVPIAERYFLGGILDVRGFNLRSIGPRLPVAPTEDPNAAVVQNGVNIGGNLEMYYNLEIEFPILQQIGVRGVIFTDGGNVWNTEQQYCNGSAAATIDVLSPCGAINTRSLVVNPLAIRTSWGVGLRWFSPLGLLRFEWGFPYQPLPFEQPSNFQFTIGNFF